MDRREQVQYLNQTLLAEMPQYGGRRKHFRWMHSHSGGCSAP